MIATTIESARITGALKCLDAMRDLENAAESADPCGPMAEYFEQRRAAVCAFVATIGPMTPEQEGAFAVLAEFIHAGAIVGDDYPSYGWIPLATMTDAEIKAKAAQADAEQAADTTAIEQARRNARKVVSITDRIPAR